MYLKGIWKKPGVFNVEDFDSDSVYLAELNRLGLPWVELHDVDWSSRKTISGATGGFNSCR